MIAITREPIDLASAEAMLHHPEAGGLTTFAGTVRNHSHGRQVLSLAYEAYPEMAQEQLKAIAQEISARWPVKKVVLIHRIGTLEIGETAVFVGVSAAHRDVAFEACRHGIEVIKRDVPIWKKERFVGGEVWVEGCEPHARPLMDARHAP
ncbi:Molybdopterin synthase catalytic subunit 1 [compost metagenome]